MQFRRIVTCVSLVLVAVAFWGNQGHAQLAPGSRATVPGGITDKPYLKNFTGGIAIGGYMDHEFFMRKGSSTFTQHRFIPFIFAEPVDFIHVTCELEFEYGGFVRSGTASGRDTDGDGQIDQISNSGTDGEIKLEFAFMDWLISDGLNFRGGLLLTPLGKFNLIHDSPLNDLTNRPIVSRQLIPTTLFEAGAGFFGSFYPQDWVIGYELYLVNGFNEKIIDGQNRVRVRGGRGSARADNNENKAIAGRLSVSPQLGIDAGLSIHSGKYDNAGERRLTIAALDLDLQRGPFQLIGEGAIVDAQTEHGHAALAAGTQHTITGGSQAGFYAQGNYHFGFGAVRRYPESVFTGIVRVERVDYNRDLVGDDEQALTFGLNFRPVEGTVAKIDHSWNWTRRAGGDVWSVPNKLWSASIATYF